MVPNEMKTQKACSTKIYPITDRERECVRITVKIHQIFLFFFTCKGFEWVVLWLKRLKINYKK